MAVAVYGMLSTIADATAENHRIPIDATVRSPPARSASASAMPPTMPTWTTASMSMNRPTKKNSVFHSMSRNASCGSSRPTSISTVAPSSAIVAASSPSAEWKRNPTRVSPRMTRARIISGRSVIAAAGSTRARMSMRSASSSMDRPKASHMIPTNATMISTTTGARLTRNAPKSRSAADPMRMFGGSPMSVAVPPMFEAKTWLIRYGNGETLRVLAIDSVTGVRRTTVVTLSSTAASSAVRIARMSRSRNGWPRDSRMA